MEVFLGEKKQGGNMAAAAKVGFPKQIRYIIGNEAAERFSYYGMRSILVIYMVKYLALQEHEAKGYFHLFVSTNYFLPLIGAYISDRYWGKYKTIIRLSVVYCLGHLVLALFEDKAGLFWGLTLISIGTGGIKPCVSAHVGDQFNASNSHLINKVYELFYFSINFGSFFSTLLIPWLLPNYGPSIAFGLPGILMFLATYIFWLGHKYYVHVPPTGKENGAQFGSILFYSLKQRFAKGRNKSDESFLDVAKSKFPAEKVEGAKAVVAVGAVFASVIGFWALFDQHGASWVLQAEKMDRMVWGFQLESSQIPALNPVMVMGIIPFFSFMLFPYLETRGLRITPLRKISAGMIIAAVSFFVVGLIQSRLDAGETVNVAWQIIPYLLLTAAEVLVSVTGLEFAYTQAPRAMKSTLSSLWLLTIAVGNFLTGIVAGLNPFHGGAMEFYFWTMFTLVLSVAFIFMARRYKERNYIENLPPGTGSTQPDLELA